MQTRMKDGRQRGVHYRMYLKALSSLKIGHGMDFPLYVCEQDSHNYFSA